MVVELGEESVTFIGAALGFPWAVITKISELLTPGPFSLYAVILILYLLL